MFEIFFIILITIIEFLGAQNNRIECLTPSPSVDEVEYTYDQFNEYKRNNQSSRDTYPVHVLVAWHVIYNSNNAGYLSMSFIENVIANINEGYNPYQIYFTLDTVTYHQNDDWCDIALVLGR